MYNYISFGLDAKFCYQFNKLREKKKWLFFSQGFNKFIYFALGLVDLFNKGSSPIDSTVKVSVDGHDLCYQGQLYNIILLNILHWGGGITKQWNKKHGYQEQKYDDGKLEVLGVTHPLRLGLIQIGLRKMK